MINIATFVALNVEPVSRSSPVQTLTGWLKARRTPSFSVPTGEHSPAGGFMVQWNPDRFFPFSESHLPACPESSENGRRYLRKARTAVHNYRLPHREYLSSRIATAERTSVDQCSGKEHTMNSKSFLLSTSRLDGHPAMNGESTIT